MKANNKINKETQIINMAFLLNEINTEKLYAETLDISLFSLYVTIG